MVAADVSSLLDEALESRVVCIYVGVKSWLQQQHEGTSFSCGHSPSVRKKRNTFSFFYSFIYIYFSVQLKASHVDTEGLHHIVFIFRAGSWTHYVPQSEMNVASIMAGYGSFFVQRLCICNVQLRVD